MVPIRQLKPPSRQFAVSKRHWRQLSYRPHLEALEDRWAPATLMVTNTLDSGPGSLRQAILDADANSDTSNTVDFNIPGSGVQTIALASPLPVITRPRNTLTSSDAVTIDGTSQPGYAGVPLIELDGANAGSGADGLDVSFGSSGSIIKGLVINRFSGTGIRITYVSNVLIQGNFIGTNAAGTAALGNGSNGIQFVSAQAFGFSAGNTVGGTTAGAGNVISGNQGSGVEILNPGAAGNLLQGNLIGTGRDGQTPLGNGGNGVWISDSADSNSIGGTAAGAGNIIGFNGASGILIDNLALQPRYGPASQNSILSNSIYANGSLGIFIQPGGNDNQAFPILISEAPLAPASLGTQIRGSLHSSANTNFRIEFFANDNPDPSGFGEAQILLGSGYVTTDGAGNASFSATVPGHVSPGQVVSATATDPNNNTSQFSKDIPPALPRDIAGRVNDTGQWWVAQSTRSSFNNQPWGSWSTGVTWVDVLRGDFTGDGHDDIVGRTASGGEWWVSVSNGSSFTNQLWTTWSTAVTWVDVRVGDFNGDGKADIAGRVLESGEWWVALSNGTSFTNQHWTSWSTAVTWKDVCVGDFNGDGRDDIAGRTASGGEWWVGLSTGSSFNNSHWATWSTTVTWLDVKVADFNGDGKADITGRTQEGGEWWTGVSTGSSFATTLWGAWNPALTWVDIQVGDFNGDGKADITGRWLQGGQWWAGISTGTSFVSSYWTTWSTSSTWVDVQVGDFNNDGLMDIAGRTQETGQWWVALSNGSQFTNQLWTTWSTGVTWVTTLSGRY